MLKGLKTKKLQRLLIGMTIILLSLIAMIDLKGYIGGILSYCFVFLFGDFYILPLLMIMFIGFKLIKDKKFKVNVPYISTWIIIILLLIFNGKNSLLIKDVTSHYLEMFNGVKPPFFSEFKFGLLDGGFIGYILYSCLFSFMGATGVNVTLLILFIITFMLALKPLINMFVNLFYDLDEKQNKKKLDKKQTTFVDYEEVKKEEKEETPLINNNFNNFMNYESTVKVSDYSNKVEEKEEKEYKSTLINDLSFNQKEEKEVIKENKERSFNIFNDDLFFEEQKEVKPIKEEKYDFFNSNLEEEYSNNVSVNDTTNEYEQEEVKEYNKTIEEEPIPSFDVNEETAVDDEEDSVIKEEVKEEKLDVKVNDIINDNTSVNNNFKEFEEENDVTPSMNIFKPNSINENKERDEIIEEKVEERKEEKPFFEPKPQENKHPYKLPPISLLDDVVNEDNEENKNEAEIKAVRLNQKLASLGINAKVIDSIVAPSFTRFIIEVASDVKLSAFNNIKQDVMMALAAEKITILAPIPGTIYVGIEIPNVKRSVVTFKEVFKDIPFKDKDQKLLAVLGKDIVGKTVTIKINKTPHLLIAGTTGSGKSVCINTIIASLLMRTSYEDVKLILVDPKRVEMAIYGDIPHLLCPVINDPIKATIALNKVVEVMDERYKLFEQEGSLCRTIETYNKIVTQRGEKPLPYIVMIIDELSDLMLVAGKDVESSILRITQLARACGIHLIVATQRPSVDVITGVIKANLPSRIAFAVSTSADSRTILDAGGAEDLLGRGDSLVALSGDLTMQRVQGAFVSDDEIYRIVEYVTKQRRPVFDPRFLNLEPKPKEVEDFSCEGLATDDGDDDLYEMIVNFLKTQKTASTSMLQSHFRIGYPKARRMIDILEENGVISEPQGTKGRKVLIGNSEE